MVTSLRALVIAGLTSSGAVQAQQPADADDAAWNRARSADTTAAYQDYLEQFPAGRHAEEAFRALVESSVEQEAGATRGGLRGADMY